MEKLLYVSPGAQASAIKIAVDMEKEGLIVVHLVNYKGVVLNHRHLGAGPVGAQELP